eukprot:g18003.t1
MAPLCVKDKKKAQAAAVATAATAAPANGQTDLVPQRRQSASKSGDVRGGGNGADAGGAGGEVPPGALALPSPCRPPPIVIQRSEIINMAQAYTSCAGCSAAVKGLLQRPIEELRLVNAVVEESHGGPGGCDSGGGSGSGGGGGKGFGKGDVRLLGNGDSGVGGPSERSSTSSSSSCGHGCGKRQVPVEAPASPSCGRGTCGQATSSIPGGLPRALSLREAYLTDRARLDQLLETFPLEPLLKKVQPKGVGLRCEIHRRNGGQATSDGWEWEDAWDRLPADMRLKVAAIDVDALEAAMHQATSTHRFCADCKHNVVTAFDILTCKCDLADIDNEDEFLPDLFWPFAGRIGPVPGDVTGQKALLSCPLEDVEELISWHEDFDSREYTRSSQRHAATLEHGQREIRSIVGSVLLSQLRTNYHNHLAQVQGEQFLFALVLQAIRTRIEGGTGEGGNPGGKKAAWLAGFGDRRTSVSCDGCDGTGLSLSELGLGEDGDKKAKTKSKKKRERKARAKAAKKSQDEDDEAAAADKAAADKAAKAAAKEANKAAARDKDKDKHKQCNGHHGANGHAGEETEVQQQEPHNPSSGNGGSGKPQQRPKTSAKAAAKAATKAATAANKAARQRAGSSGIESAGSLLSMLDDANGMPGGYGGEDDGEDGDAGIDEEIVREMERLKIQKAQTDVQRTRAALRSNLQKNFNQLLVSSTACKGGRGKA